jgi:predicted PhzF superfamily epimerase YddE/YHI9
MSTYSVYQIDAFTDQVFGGNPAAVMPLDGWLDDDTLQSIAAENNLSETAFFVPNGETGNFGLRWFTPKLEVDLCGHATLASSYFIFNHLHPELNELNFDTESGRLKVTKEDDLLVLDFPARVPVPAPLPDGFVGAIGHEPSAFLKSIKNLAVFDDAATVLGMEPDFSYVADLDGDGLIITAPGNDCDFVSRYFAPHAGINEDPVTGSAHCTAVPYWADRLGKNELHARQVSERGGELFCELSGDRVRMAGKAVLYMKGEIFLP